ncbi:CG33672, partial [Drosophila busckii]
MSKYNTKYLEDKLRQELQATHVEVYDDSDGCGGKFSVIIVSNVFEGKSLLQKHRLVNTTLAEELKKIHAFSQKSYTPKEWEEKVQQQ